MKKAILLQDTALRYFLEVARCGSIREASTHLNVASSAISRQIASLESILETEIFERKPRGMELNSAGELLAVHARKAALGADWVVSEIQALKGLQKGEVKVACSEGFAIDFLPRLIEEFRHVHQGIYFHVSVSAPVEVTRKVSLGDADLGLTFCLRPSKEIHVEYRQSSTIFAVMHPEHHLANKEFVTLADIHGFPLALPDEGTTIRQLFDICCSSQGYIFNPVFESNYMAALHHFSAIGGGISLAGEISMRSMLTNGQVVGVPIREQTLGIRNIEVQRLSGRTLPVAVQAFLDFLIKKMPGDSDLVV